MNIDYYTTDDSCKKCAKSFIEDISSDYEEHKWSCLEGHNIHNEIFNDKKPCGLKKNQYFQARYVVVNMEQKC